ncbi:glycosyltransferase family 4 protein [Desulfovibrio sulfodismutans]|uniref:Glycosyltransferase family 4 protein n=1 Tax=Desulfolutivibrio sulfodismutans TaxID=63561 RepID=A0A7K3NH59_9BACT|nr:glycosyltransferase family 4 protein [Desulfolutivibrio sulfodismutans]NDY55531.1 glycosyltransferase family 4 protein [Desulfolutivibrio sulfodismutans]QLA11434.1 glycosyltransferase [Desulfolutivibrio sulfodismutans DSM 3696]
MPEPRLWGTLDPFLESGDALGRKAANAGFLDALLDADPFDAYHFYLASPKDRDEQARMLGDRRPGLARRGKFKFLTRLDLPAGLRHNDYFAFHLSDCINYPAHLARLRNLVSRDIFPITSVTHSLSYAAYGRDFLLHLWPGATARDAVVATSRAAVDAVLQFYAYLSQGYPQPGALVAPEAGRPRVVRLPLGVDVASFAVATDQARREAREMLGIPPDATVFLIFARISHSSKLDPLPVLRAFQRLLAEHRRTNAGAPPCLVMAGWTEEGGEAFTKALTDLAAGVGLSFRLFPRPDEARKRRIFAASDVFLSPVDNLQETFGLSILEAMACGLPVAASDFDGYRDLVAHGRTGLLVPTLGPAATPLLDALSPLCFDNHAHLIRAQQCVVDVPQLARALADLADDPALRRQMGHNGRRRVEAEFSWDHVVSRYLSLWEDLRREPVPDRDVLRGTPHPMHIPYGRVFRGHPSALLDPAQSVAASRAGQAVYRGQDFPVIYPALDALFDMETLKRLLVLARNPLPVAELAGKLMGIAPDMDEERAAFCILWALKHDLLERAGDAATIRDAGRGQAGEADHGPS